MKQRPINLTPRAQYWEAWKLSFDGPKLLIEPMRFVPHDGQAKP
jgi:hypothetical protein